MEMRIDKRKMHNPFRAREASGRGAKAEAFSVGGCVPSRDVCRSPNLDWQLFRFRTPTQPHASAYTSQIMPHLNIDSSNNVSLM
jgi:hypothetical protein